MKNDNKKVNCNNECQRAKTCYYCHVTMAKHPEKFNNNLCAFIVLSCPGGCNNQLYSLLPTRRCGTSSQNCSNGKYRESDEH